MLQQFPSAFEFTEVYLTALWDSVTLGVFRNFMHSSSLSQHKFVPSEHSVSVWDWENQFDDDTVGLFCNPLYPISAGKRGSEGQSWTFPRCVSNTQQRTGHFTAPRPLTCSSVSVLRPRYHMPDLHVWSLCYLRWLTPVQVVHGGSPSELIVQNALLSDIYTLQQDIARLSGNQTVMSRQPSHHQQRDVSVMRLPQRVSSSYPFAAYQLSNHATHSGYCSSVRLSYSEDSFGVDEVAITDVSNSDE